jgi:hypothetical protein
VLPLVKYWPMSGQAIWPCATTALGVISDCPFRMMTQVEFQGCKDACPAGITEFMANHPFVESANSFLACQRAGQTEQWVSLSEFP